MWASFQQMHVGLVTKGFENTCKKLGFAHGAAAKLVATPMDAISRLAKASAKKAG